MNPPSLIKAATPVRPSSSPSTGSHEKEEARSEAKLSADAPRFDLISDSALEVSRPNFIVSAVMIRGVPLNGICFNRRVREAGDQCGGGILRL